MIPDEQLREKAKDIIVAYVGICLSEVTDEDLARSATNEPHEIAALTEALSHATVVTDCQWEISEQGEYL